MSAFEVQFAGLYDTGRTLTHAGDLLRGASTALLRMDSGALADDRLEAALHGFARRWGSGISELADATAVAGRQVVEAARCYGAVESGLARTLASTMEHTA
jgi:hypothetical protein